MFPFPSSTSSSEKFRLRAYLPFLSWLPHYQSKDLIGDLIAGLIVAIMIVPQGMAYSVLIGIPPEMGLCASILPLIVYGLLGTSRTLSVGPVVIVSLLILDGIAPLAEAGHPARAQLAMTLALLVGLFQLAMGLIRLGFLVNFLSHPVLIGFTSAAAVKIGFSQLDTLLGISTPHFEHLYEEVLYLGRHIFDGNWATFGVGLVCLTTLLYFKDYLADHLKQLGLTETIINPLTKLGSLMAALIGSLLVWGLALDEAGVKTVGDVPSGLPPLTLPSFDFQIWQALVPTAFAIAFVGYVESISVAKSLASKRRQKVEADQELIALGAANLGATFTGGFPVTGALSRSIVNFSSGANSGLASMITALLVLLTLLFLTPLFYYLPLTVLAAIILVSAVSLIDLTAVRYVWAYSKADSISLFVTFGAILIAGIETGILYGVGTAIALFIWHTSQPYIAELGRIVGTELYRNILRPGPEPMTTYPEVLAVRVDESLYFANTKYLEDTVLKLVVERPEIKHFILVGVAINFIDSSALETLESLRDQLRDGGVEFHLAAIKAPVMFRLDSIGFAEKVGHDHIHISTHHAMQALGYA